MNIKKIFFTCLISFVPAGQYLLAGLESDAISENVCSLSVNSDYKKPDQNDLEVSGFFTDKQKMDEERSRHSLMLIPGGTPSEGSCLDLSDSDEEGIERLCVCANPELLPIGYSWPGLDPFRMAPSPINEDLLSNSSYASYDTQEGVPLRYCQSALAALNPSLLMSLESESEEPAKPKRIDLGVLTANIESAKRALAGHEQPQQKSQQKRLDVNPDVTQKIATIVPAVVKPVCERRPCVCRQKCLNFLQRLKTRCGNKWLALKKHVQEKRQSFCNRFVEVFSGIKSWFTKKTPQARPQASLKNFKEIAGKNSRIVAIKQWRWFRKKQERA